MPNPTMGTYDEIYDWCVIYNSSTWETSQIDIWMYNGICGVYIAGPIMHTYLTCVIRFNQQTSRCKKNTLLTQEVFVVG